MKNADRTYNFRTSRGPSLFVQEWGRLDRPVVLFFHGFPGCGDQAKLMTTFPRHDAFRLIAMDRPGYGKSERQKSQTPLGFAQQVVELLEFLKIHKLNILYVSGGAPYGMATAFLLQERVLRMSSVAGIAPVTSKNFRYLNSKQKKAWLTQKIVPAYVLDQLLGRALKRDFKNLDELLFGNLDSYSAPDQLVFRDPQIGPFLNESFQSSLLQGPGGVVDDMLVYGKNWGFPLSEIRCPITFWHGDADDVVHVQIAHDMKRHFAKSSLNVTKNEGHYSLARNYRDQILSDLLRLT